MLAPKGLKVGDTFKDELGIRKVIEVGQINGIECYNSILVTGEPEKVEIPVLKVEEPEVEETKAEEPKELDYDSMTLKELQNLAKERGLAIRGSKQDVIDRLRG